jgi:hypothetical protein
VAFASLDDINQHLPASTLQITESEDEPWQVDAERIIRGYLSGLFSPVTIASWTTPGSTPDLLRSIAGRLIAGWFYRSKVAGETPEEAEYPTQLYNEAIGLLMQIRTGDVILVDVEEEITVGDSITADDFYPNDETDPAPMFSISQQFS